MAKAKLAQLLPLKKLSLQDELVFKFRSFFNRIEMMKKFVRCFKEVTLFDIGVGGEGLKPPRGKII